MVKQTALVEARIKAALTGQEAAEKIGVHPVTLSRYENGHFTPPVRVLGLMADVYGVTVDVLLGR